MSIFVPRTLDELAQELREGWPGQIDHLSSSSITMLLRCPEQYRQRYILGKKDRPGAAAIWGRADHEAVAMHFGQVIDGKPGLSVADVQDQFITSFDAEVESMGWSEIDWRGTPSQVAASIKDNGAYLAGLYRQNVADYVQPIGVELKFAVKQPHWPVEVIGYVDIEEADTLIDRKTTGRTESKPKPDWVVQSRIYQLAKPKVMHFHQSVKNERDKTRQQAYGVMPNMVVGLDPMRDLMTDKLVVQAMQTVKSHFLQYGPDETWPGALTHPWACGYCGYAVTCQWQVGAV
jgi:hypothetical protein